MKLSELVVALLLLPSVVPARQASLQRVPSGVDVTSYDIGVTLPDSGKVVAMNVAVTFQRTGPVDTLALNLVGMHVDEVLVQDSGSAFVRDERTLRIPLPASRITGADVPLRVIVRYHGVPTDGLIIRADAIDGWSAFGDNWPERARNWIACVDHPADKAAVNWTIDAPSYLTVVANGRAEGEEARGRRMVTRWRESNPIPTYCMVLAAASFQKVDLGTSPVPQQAFVLPDAMSGMPGSFSQAPDIAGFFASIIAPFPYEKLAHVQSRTVYGGMENASCIFYSHEVFTRPGDNTGIIAHETAHQWFGDAITPASWSQVWLSEGFATFYERLWRQHAEGDSVFRMIMTRSRESVLSSEVCHQRPVIDTIETDPKKLLNTNSYQKGAWVLHMARGLLGEEKFDEAVKLYFNTHRHGTVRTEDLQQAFSAAAGKEMDWFFRQWLRRAGAPELSVSWKYNAGRKAVELRVVQTQTGAPYRLPIHVDVTDADGFERHVVVMIPAEKISGALVPASAKPKKVAIDPHADLLAKIAIQ